MTEQALAEVKVLDLTHYIAGPCCTKMLADFGADVIKIERPDGGDPARRLGPFLNDEPGPERSGLFFYLNNNKKSVTLNLKSATGVKIFKELAKNADAVVESFKPGTMARFGLDYPILSEINPRLVMTSISSFGQTGPYRDYKSAHLIAWGMSGARYNDGEPGVKPVQAGGWLTHYIAGVQAVVGTATALYQRSETGSGQHVDISILESIISVTCYPAVIYSYLGLVHNPVSKPYLGIFRCKDGYIGLNVYTLPQWEMLCSFFGKPELSQDPRFSTLTNLNEHLDEARAIFAPLVAEREKTELFQSGNEWRIPFALVPTSSEILESPQHKARMFFEEIDHPVMGKVTMPGAPFKMMETPWQLKSRAPLLGEHNEEVYCRQLGYSKDNVVKLRERGII
jgi:crotonobetainyl-CoA:carnitine CoA-transferase CaiB-like acyl-CoA transferase